MCTYKYKSKNIHHNIGSTCIYSNDNNKIYNEQAPPIDDDGKCIFHSSNLSWKKANNFDFHLKALIKYYEKYIDNHELIDFSEIIFVSSGENSDKICFSDLKFKRYIDMNYCTFHENLLINNCELVGLDILGGKFEKYSTISNCSIRSLNFSKSVFEEKFSITKTKIDSYSDFEKCTFADTISFIDVEFGDMVQFNWVNFETKDINYCITTFKNIKFSGQPLNFSNAKFNSCVVFNNVEFDTDCLFVNAEFNSSKNSDSSCGALDFSNIKICTQDKMTFIGTETNKLFSNEVRFTNLNLEGEIIFENVNYNQLTKNTRDNFSKLEKQGKVIIKKGCIKYRHQSESKKIYVKKENQELIIEMSRVFNNYFVVNNGRNLGFEIIERTPTYLHCFYFTDENITESEFGLRLQDSSIRFWEEKTTNVPNNNTFQLATNYLAEIIAKTDIEIDKKALFGKLGARNQYLPEEEFRQLLLALRQVTNFTGEPTLESPKVQIFINQYQKIMNINSQNNYNSKVINADYYNETFGLPSMEFEQLKNSMNSLDKYKLQEARLKAEQIENATNESKLSKKDELKNFLIDCGIAINQNLAASLIYDMVKPFIGF